MIDSIEVNAEGQSRGISICSRVEVVFESFRYRIVRHVAVAISDLLIFELALDGRLDRCAFRRELLVSHIVLSVVAWRLSNCLASCHDSGSSLIGDSMAVSFNRMTSDLFLPHDRPCT